MLFEHGVCKPQTQTLTTLNLNSATSVKDALPQNSFKIYFIAILASLSGSSNCAFANMIGPQISVRLSYSSHLPSYDEPTSKSHEVTATRKATKKEINSLRIITSNWNPHSKIALFHSYFNLITFYTNTLHFIYTNNTRITWILNLPLLRQLPKNNLNRKYFKIKSFFNWKSKRNYLIECKCDIVAYWISQQLHFYMNVWPDDGLKILAETC